MVTRFRTDKDSPHGYVPDYEALAERLGPDAVVCEVGVEQGLSLEMWRVLFPLAVIIGVDHNYYSVWPEGTIKVVAEQDHPDLAAMVSKHAPDGCDLIVEDASHIGHLSRATFTLLWPLVRPGGFYVLEDWADPWVFPRQVRWPQVNPELEGDELHDYVPSMIGALRDGAARVTYTYEGLVIIEKGR